MMQATPAMAPRVDRGNLRADQMTIREMIAMHIMAGLATEPHLLRYDRDELAHVALLRANTLLTHLEAGSKNGR